ncbi:MAG: nuclear transport factor 2 family protein [Acidimicrobiales bacterium]|jgi:hypothetical protein|nr:MAG: hypothetical protein MB52_06855 [marine actinobacterium MedAcidi-G1]MAU35501.1 hypothetical protein [Actinomycetota bacterium]HAQ03824.1 hypothetical protein [Acidimicrobiaceae bacterium]|tara:strand:+ start:36 stop:464 length:429 start_codon:yes stop_codon:yes gene_type:complete
MIEKTIENWHSFLRGDLELDDLIHEECIFFSPVVFKPLKGRELTKLYLNAAYKVFPGDKGEQENNQSLTNSGSFNYTKYILNENHAALEFETIIDGIEINGIDIISCDDESLITEFKVMIRSKKAIDKIQSQMASMIENMSL